MIRITGEDRVERRPLLSLSNPEPEMVEGYEGDYADKLDLTLREDSPGKEILSSAVKTGNIDQYRRLLAQRDMLEQAKYKNEVLSSIFSSDPSAITPQVVEVVTGLTQSEIESPDLKNVIEQKYARLFTNVAAAEIETGVLEEALEEDPDAALEILDRTERVVYKKNLIAKKAAEVQKVIDDQSWGESVWNFTERMIPFVEWYQKINQVGHEGDFVSSILPGNNLEEQFSYLWLLDTKRFTEEFERAYEDLRSRNPYVAQSWLEGLVSYGGTGAFMDNLIGVVDVASVSPLKTLGKALSGITRTAARSPRKIAEHATAAGKYDAASTAKVVEDISQGVFFPDNIRNAKELENAVPTMSAPHKVLVGSDKLPAEAVNRLKEQFSKSSELARRFLYEPNLIDRASPEELIDYADDLRRAYVKDNPSVQKSVIDVEVSDVTDVGNVYNAKIILGRRDGTLFDSEAEARSYFDRFVQGTDDYKINQVGQGFQIEILKTVNESRPSTKILPTSVKTPESLANSFLSAVRSDIYKVSQKQQLARSTAVTSSERLASIFNEIAEPLRVMPQKEFNELRDFMKWNEDTPRFENIGSFHENWMEKYGQAPSLSQIEGYFAASRIHDLDYVVRDLDVYKQKVALGLEQMQIRTSDGIFDFEGRVIDNLPFSSETPFRYTVIDGNDVKTARYSQYAGKSGREEIDKLISQGFKIVQTSDAYAFQTGAMFSAGKKNFAEYVVTNNLKRNRVGVKNFERRPELGHKVDSFPGYIKQGRIDGDDSGRFYRGDVSLFGVRSAKEGKEFVQELEAFRKELLAGDRTALRRIRDRLGISPKQFLAAVNDGTINLSVPFAYVQKGSRSIDTGVYSGMSGLQDVTRSEHSLSSKIRGRYLGERDQSDLKVIESEGDLVFNIRQEERLDPFDTLTLSAKNLLSTRLMNDYTMMTTRDFIREFGPILDGTLEEVESLGTAFLLNPVFKSGADPIQVQKAKNVSQAYRNLMNVRTDLDRKIDAVLDPIRDSIIKKFGPRGLNWVNEPLGTIKNPDVYMKRFAFDLKLGMFNPVQYFVQMQTATNVMAIAGTRGVRGVASYPIFRAALQTNDLRVIDRLASVAEGTRLMTKEEFKDILDLYKKSGFHLVGKDTAFLDDISSPELRKTSVRGAASSVLTWGRTPFQEGERVIRISGFAAAYLEKKALKGSSKMTRRDEAEILQRAKLLTGDMTRESNAPWQKGYASVMTQFFGYQARIMEQFLGKRLTAMEKARLFSAYSLVYGVPVAGGAVTGFIPWRDILLDVAASNGWDINDTGFEPFVDGLASTFLEAMGMRELNIASRYGPGGIPSIYDIMTGDSEFYDWFMGASGSIALDTMSSALPILKGMLSWSDDFEGGYYNLKAEDFLAPLRNISTVDNLTKLYQVYNTGIWASKNGTNLVEMGVPDALISAITGLQPAEIEDAFALQQGAKSHKDWLFRRQLEATKAFRQAMKMEPGREQEKRIREIKAQMHIDGLDPWQRRRALKDAMSTEMITDRFFENFEKQFDLKTKRSD